MNKYYQIGLAKCHFNYADIFSFEELTEVKPGRIKAKELALQLKGIESRGQERIEILIAIQEVTKVAKSISPWAPDFQIARFCKIVKVKEVVVAELLSNKCRRDIKDYSTGSRMVRTDSKTAQLSRNSRSIVSFGQGRDTRRHLGRKTSRLRRLCLPPGN